MSLAKSRPPGRGCWLRESAAAADAPWWRLRAAGAVLFGRTNMVEFAFSGVGINPHYGTIAQWLATPQAGGRSAVVHPAALCHAVDGMCVAALGTDTGGSVRIPAAFQSVPRVSADGVPGAGQ